jgi:hypothetical protein
MARAGRSRGRSVLGVVHAHARRGGPVIRCAEIEGWVDPDLRTRDADALGRQVTDAVVRQLPKAGSLTWSACAARWPTSHEMARYAWPLHGRRVVREPI